MNKCIYIVHTPYQIMSVLNIIMECNKTNKHIILLSQKNLQKYIHLFNDLNNVDIYYEKDLCMTYKVSSVLSYHIKMLYVICRMKKIISNLSYLDNSIQKVFVPSDDITCRILFNRIKKLNPLVKLCLYDDGVGTYILRPFRKKSFLGEIVYALLLDKCFYKYISSVYCYNTDIVIQSEFKFDLIKINSSNEIKERMKCLLGNLNDKYSGKKVVFLDQGLSEDENIQKCLKILNKHFIKDEVIVKIHPRIIGKTQYEFETSNDGCPFEIISSVCDFTNSLLISHSSGGIITPLLMYGQNRGIIIYLYALSKKNEFSDSHRYFFSQLMDVFKNNSIFIPQSVDEFDKIISEFKHKFISI